MVAVVQAVPTTELIRSPPSLAPIARTAQGTQRANTSLLTPSVILTLGTTPAGSLTYNATGLFQSLLQTVGPVQDIAGVDAGTSAGTNATAAAASSAMASNFLQDAITQAVATISGNPAYAMTAAGLYMNVEIFRAQQALLVSRPKAAETPGPVIRASAVKAV